MTRFVVDASVAMKWFIPEVHSDSAIRLQQSDHELHVPTFFVVEIGNILWKKLQRGELTRTDAGTILQSLLSIPLQRHPDTDLILDAFSLAEQTSRTVYDCVYLALAIRIGGKFVTADERFWNALRQTSVGEHLCWIEDVPAADQSGPPSESPSA